MKARSPLIWFGGKEKVAKYIIAKMPEHKTYCEPFGGAAHVIAQKPRSDFEIYNDIDGDLVNFLMVVREQTYELARACDSLPYSRKLYEEWRDSDWPEDKFERAVRFFYLNRSGIAKGNGPASGRTGWRHHHSANTAQAYRKAIDLFESFANRMRYVQIDCNDFRKVILENDTPETLFYVDPPYFGREKYYAGGFTEQDHRDLAKILNSVKGKVILSYYDHPLLAELYPGWHIESYTATKQMVNNGSQKAQELLLMNYYNSLQLSLFD